jgi:hypothetical protein
MAKASIGHAAVFQGAGMTIWTRPDACRERAARLD